MYFLFDLAEEMSAFVLLKRGMKVAGTLPIEITRLFSILIGLFLIDILQKMRLLEIKHGLLQLAESLNFLHSNAHLIHRAISSEVLPESIGATKPYLRQFIDV
uniref:Uncharacterized protein n=1 Tax=Cucumis melo TaxID=3656 RepID=A0A9I9ECV2_CUCME